MRQWYNPFTWSFHATEDAEDYTQYQETHIAPHDFDLFSHGDLNLPTTFACVSLLADVVSTIPLKAYKNIDGSREPLVGSLARILKNPNSSLKQCDFLTQAMLGLVLKGDSFSLIKRSEQDGRVLGVFPFKTNEITIDTSEQGDVYYIAQAANGKKIVFLERDIIHFRYLAKNGLKGFNRMDAQSSLLKANKTAHEYGNHVIKSGGLSGGYLIYDQFLKDEQREAIQARFGNPEKAGMGDLTKTVVLEGNPKFIPASMSSRDAQFLETKEAQGEDICGIFRVPPHMIGKATASAWGTGIEQMTLGFVKFTLQPYLTQIEQELNKKLFKKADEYCEFVIESLLKGDSASESAYLTAALGGSGGSGWMSVNEARRVKNLPKLADSKYDDVVCWQQNISGNLQGDINDD